MFIGVRDNLRMRSGTPILTSFANIFPGSILILNLKMLLLPPSHNGVRDRPSSYGSFLPVFNLPFDSSTILGGRIYLRDWRVLNGANSKINILRRPIFVRLVGDGYEVLWSIF